MVLALRFAVLALVSSLGSGCCFGLIPPEPAAVTDDPARRAEAIAVATAYFESHRAELGGTQAAVVGSAVQGGSIEDVTSTAFEVRLELVDRAARDDLPRGQAADVIVYVVAESPPRAVGAQARTVLDAVMFDIGDRLDRRFTSRD